MFTMRNPDALCLAGTADPFAVHLDGSGAVAKSPTPPPIVGTIWSAREATDATHR